MSVVRRKGRALKGMAVERLDSVGDPASRYPFAVAKSDTKPNTEAQQAVSRLQEDTASVLMSVFKDKTLTVSKETADALSKLASDLGFEGHEDALAQAVAKGCDTTGPGKAKTPKMLKKTTAAKKDADEDQEDDDEDDEVGLNDEDEDEDEDDEDDEEELDASPASIAKSIERAVQKAVNPLRDAIAEVASLATGEKYEHVDVRKNRKGSKKRKTTKTVVESRQAMEDGQRVEKSKDQMGSGLFSDVIFS